MDTMTETTTRHTVTSQDGTSIAWWSGGDGPPLVCVHGASSNHTTWQPLRPFIEPDLALHAMDRRGRGGSGDSATYHLQREYEDIVAVVDAVAESAGQPVDLLGHSFGGLCVLGAARLTDNVRRLVLYEGWPATDPTVVGPPADVIDEIDRLLDAGDPDAALAAMYHDIMSPGEVEAFRASPAWPARVAAAHTIPREGRALREVALDPAALADVTAPTLLIVGGDTPRALVGDPAQVATALPDAHICVLDGQQHIAHYAAPAEFARAVLDFLDPPATPDRVMRNGRPDHSGAARRGLGPEPPTTTDAADGPPASVRTRALLHDVAGTGDPLVLVPGGLTGWLSWIPHQERFADHHRVVRVQPIHNELGSAGVTGMPGYTAETERESLRLTLDELALERADLVGWSNGAKSLLEFAIAYPERVRTLTLIEPPAYWVLGELGQDDSAPREFVASTYEFAGTEVSEDDLATFLAVAGLAASPVAARQHPSWDDWVPHRAALSWLTPELMEPPRTLADLAAITCPVLLTRGTTTSPWQAAVVEGLAGQLHDARMVELSGGHAHHLESIDAFIDVIESHLHAPMDACAPGRDGFAGSGARRAGSEASKRG